MGHRVKSHRRAIAPSPDTYAGTIELGALSEELVERGELIFQFNRAELVTDRGHKLAVAGGSTAIVEGKDRESSPGQKLVEESGGTLPVLEPAIGDELRGGAAVDVYDQWDLAG